MPNSKIKENREASYRNKIELLEEQLKELEEVNQQLDTENQLVFEEIQNQEKELSHLDEDIFFKRTTLFQTAAKYNNLKQENNEITIKNNMRYATKKNQLLFQSQKKFKNENEALLMTINTLKLKNGEIWNEIKNLNKKQQTKQRDYDVHEL